MSRFIPCCRPPDLSDCCAAFIRKINKFLFCEQNILLPLPLAATMTWDTLGGMKSIQNVVDCIYEFLPVMLLSSCLGLV